MDLAVLHIWLKGSDSPPAEIEGQSPRDALPLRQDGDMSVCVVRKEAVDEPDLPPYLLLAAVVAHRRLVAEPGVVLDERQGLRRVRALGAGDRQDSFAGCLLAGGVSANQLLREELQKNFAENYQVFYPQPNLSTDNGAMVASAAYYSIQAGEKPGDPYELDISPRSTIK